MPAKFTKFSVWEADTRQIIKDIYHEIKKYNDKMHQLTTADLEQRLTSWFYTSGIEIFTRSQGKAFKEYVDGYLAEHQVRPDVTYERMVENKKIGFEALYPALLSEFQIRNDGLEFYVRDEWQGYKDKGLKHADFFRLQAEITTALHKALDQQPLRNWTDADKQAFTRAQYEAAKVTHPDLVTQIDNQLLLQVEFQAYMAERMQAMPATNIASLFNRSAQADSITVQRAHDLLANTQVVEGEFTRRNQV